MIHNRKKMALYEVISKTRPKPSYDKLQGQNEPKKSGEDVPDISRQVIGLPKKTSQWPRRPRFFQLNAGRIEIAMPYQLAIVVLLVAILLLMVAFRLGMNAGSQKNVDTVVKIPAVQQNSSAAIKTDMPVIVGPIKEKPATGIEVSESKGSNRIVIQTYDLRPHLVPVQQYFTQFGIETEIRKIGDMYYLVSAGKYENPQRQGTDGYAARQRIIELGANYKAPPGFETFGPKPFSDAYGMKFDD